jgi:hypothetical protein
MVVCSWKGNACWLHGFTLNNSYIPTFRKHHKYESILICIRDLMKCIIIFVLDSKIGNCSLHVNIQKVLLN